MKCRYILLLAFAFSWLSCQESTDYKRVSEDQITWIDIQQAADIKNVEKKMYFVDLYTDWCGWCKVMDKKTFTDPKVIEMMNQYFHAVKFDVEQKESVTFEGKEYKWAPGGRNGTNSLTMELINGRPSYPTFVYLDENRKVIKQSTGYKKPDAFILDMLTVINR